jgi:electron transport complex protein RnfE
VKDNFTKGIIKENPIFVLLLLMAPVLAITTNVENAIVMGISVLFVLLFSNIIVSIFKKYITDKINIYVYLIISAILISIVEWFLHTYVEDIYKVLGIYIPLLVVDSIVLNRALEYASKEKLLNSIVDALSFGIGTLLALVGIGLFREILGNNTITIMDKLSVITGYEMKYQVLPNSNIFPIKILMNPAGAFLSLGLLIGIFNIIKMNKGDKA